MNTNIMNADSLLSNISNISVKIDHNRHDGSGFFNNYAQEKQEEKQIYPEPVLELEKDHSSLLDKINLKGKEPSAGNEPENTWVTGNNVAGVSEEQDDSSEEKNQQDEQISQKKLSKHDSHQPSELIDAQQEEKQRKLMEKRLKNQTKNIPKNYGKAIITFIQKYSDKVRYILRKNGIEYEDFIDQLKERKKNINTIADLRNLWVDYKYAKVMRLLSNLFLRKYALHYIFNSRICNYNSHIKYRYRLCQAIKEPYTFKHIKDY